MSNKLLTTTLVTTMALFTMGSANFAFAQTTPTNQPIVTEDPDTTTTRDTQDRNTRSDNRGGDFKATTRAYPAVDNNCRMVNGRRVCDKTGDYDSDAAKRNRDLDSQDDSRSLNR